LPIHKKFMHSLGRLLAYIDVILLEWSLAFSSLIIEVVLWSLTTIFLEIGTELGILEYDHVARYFLGHRVGL